jgi:processive 1,2-diacylglycerol beta-glucosyltransferase
MIERRPEIWSFVYMLLHRTPLMVWTLPFMGGVGRVLREKVDSERPDVIVSTYPLYSYLLNKPGESDEARPFRLYTVVTDSITINSVWHGSPSDAWLVPNEASAAVMRSAGVPAERVIDLGFPVPPIFAVARPSRTPPGGREPLRVLYMINAGQATAPALVARLLEIEGITLTVTAGKDDVLREALEQKVRESGKAAQVHGWTPDMPHILMSHHVLIGKAGGAAVQETIAARTPMLITKVVPGQEEGNAQLLLQNDCGAVCDTTESLITALHELVADGAAKWRRWEANIARLSRPDAALRMAEWICRNDRALAN